MLGGLNVEKKIMADSGSDTKSHKVGFSKITDE